MNIFEGGRRVARVVVGIVFVMYICFAVIQISEGNLIGAGECIGYAIGSAVVFWAAICAFGWAVRGFLGVPNGQDYKVEPLQK